MYYVLKDGSLVSIVSEKADVDLLIAAGIADDYILL